MYVQVETDKFFRTEHNIQIIPIATLADEYGGKIQIAVDDYCYVIYLKTKRNFYRLITHISQEVFKVLRNLPLLE